MIVYLDLIILANFLLDYCFITYTGLISGEKIKYHRIILSTLFATSGLVLFYIHIKSIFLILRIVYSLLIIMIAFPIISIKKYLKNLCLFYLLNYVTAGIIVSYDFQFSNNAIFVNLNNQTTWYLLIFSFLFSLFLTYIYKVIEENHAQLENRNLDVVFIFLKHEYKVKGLVDTGNIVTTYGDNLPVVFIDKELILDDINEMFLIKNNIQFTYVSINTINSKSLILAFKPEFFGVIINDKLCQKEVYVTLSQNIKGNLFNVILNSKILV